MNSASPGGRAPNPPRAQGGLELRDITVERGGRPVVKDVTITVPAGEVTALLGPNGAGKSSLVLAVGGVLRPRPGSVLLDGTELAGRGPSGSAPPASRSSPRDGGCCPTCPSTTTSRSPPTR